MVVRLLFEQFLIKFRQLSIPTSGHTSHGILYVKNMPLDSYFKVKIALIRSPQIVFSF